jgi:hypothetical protein
MKNTIFALVAVGILSSATGCAYGGAAMGSADKVVVTRNDGFLFGILRKVYVCKVADAGLSACGDSEAP